jgi:hypothetical protein
MTRRRTLPSVFLIAATVGVAPAHAQSPTPPQPPLATTADSEAGPASGVRVTRGPAAAVPGKSPPAVNADRIVVDEKADPVTPLRATAPTPREFTAPLGEPGKAETQWPKTLNEDVAATPPALKHWTREEIDAGRAKCKAVLSGLTAVTTPTEPMRDGECGTAAPVELHSIGTNPRVTFPAGTIVTCEMVAAMETWLRNDVQPAARSLLGSPVVRAEVMSSYSCRRAYGRKMARLSEHGRANAVDISSFKTERGDTIDMLGDWGMTERDIKAHIAAAKAEEARKEAAAKKEAERQAVAAKAKPGKGPADKGPAEAAKTEAPKAAPVVVKNAGAQQLRGTITEDTAAVRQAAGVALGRTASPSASPTLEIAPPSRLGGPKEATASSNTADTSKPKEVFLRRIHAGACRIFGTTLGPEANDAHRNHLHVDLAERRASGYCE